MKVKGTAVKVLIDFVRKNYPDYFNTWMESLPDESKRIFEGIILSSQWYELVYSHTVPTEVLADIIGVSAETMAQDIGEYSAEAALNGIYRIFLKLASMKYAIQRIPQIFQTYYDPAHTELIKTTHGDVIFKFGYTTERENLLYYRNKGWIRKFLELAFNSRSSRIELKIEKDPEILQFYAIFHIMWEEN
jgi:hypothetical protein